jgi:hypothetical protein
MIEVGSCWRYNMGDLIMVVIESTMIRAGTGDVRGVIIKHIDDSTATELKIPVSTLLLFFTQLTPIEMELL